MKKLSILLILIIGWSELRAQTGEPCTKVIDQNRSVTETGLILQNDAVLTMAYAEVVDYNSGRNIVPLNLSVDEMRKNIITHTVLVDANSFVNPADYRNGIRFNGIISYTNLLGTSSIKWLAYLAEDGTYIPYAKVCCLNPQKKRVPTVPEKPIEKRPLPRLVIIDEPKKSLVIVDDKPKPVVNVIAPPKKCFLGKHFLGLPIWADVLIASAAVGTYEHFAHKSSTTPPASNPVGVPTQPAGGPVGAPTHP
jgi:hypothetical protein